ncbi:hypothetical protein YC2023_033530 [Brassica napus]
MVQKINHLLQKLHIRRNSSVERLLAKPAQFICFIYSLQRPAAAGVGEENGRDRVCRSSGCWSDRFRKSHSSPPRMALIIGSWTLITMRSRHRSYLLLRQSFRLQRPNQQGKIQSIILKKIYFPPGNLSSQASLCLLVK